MRLRINRDIKLIAVRVWTTICHSEQVWLVVMSTVYIFIVKVATVYTPALRCAPGLIHKSRDDAMKLRAFVSPDMSIAVVLIIIRYQFPKILTRFRMRVVVEF